MPIPLKKTSVDGSVEILFFLVAVAFATYWSRCGIQTCYLPGVSHWTIQLDVFSPLLNSLILHVAFHCLKPVIKNNVSNIVKCFANQFFKCIHYNKANSSSAELVDPSNILPMTGIETKASHSKVIAFIHGHIQLLLLRLLLNFGKIAQQNSYEGRLMYYYHLIFKVRDRQT